MRRLILMLACVAGPLVMAEHVAAQVNQVRVPPKNWATLWGGAYLEPGPLSDPTTNTDWHFGSAFAAGGGIHHQIGQGLVIGADGSYAPSVPFEYVNLTSNLTTKAGSARLGSAVLSGRLQYGGGGSLGVYLTGGAGAFFWGLPDIANGGIGAEDRSSHWDGDLALLTGAGFEYRGSGKMGIFVEWGRNWIFHQRSGTDDNSNKFSGIRGGVRLGV